MDNSYNRVIVQNYHTHLSDHRPTNALRLNHHIRQNAMNLRRKQVMMPRFQTKKTSPSTLHVIEGSKSNLKERTVDNYDFSLRSPQKGIIADAIEKIQKQRKQYVSNKTLGLRGHFGRIPDYGLEQSPKLLRGSTEQLDVYRSKNTMKSSMMKNTEELRTELEVNEALEIEQLKQKDENLYNSIAAIEDLNNRGFIDGLNSQNYPESILLSTGTKGQDPLLLDGPQQEGLQCDDFAQNIGSPVAQNKDLECLPYDEEYRSKTEMGNFNDETVHKELESLMAGRATDLKDFVSLNKRNAAKPRVMTNFRKECSSQSPKMVYFEGPTAHLQKRFEMKGSKIQSIWRPPTKTKLKMDLTPTTGKTSPTNIKINTHALSTMSQNSVMEDLINPKLKGASSAQPEPDKQPSFVTTIDIMPTTAGPGGDKNDKDQTSATVTIYQFPTPVNNQSSLEMRMRTRSTLQPYPSNKQAEESPAITAGRGSLSLYDSQIVPSSKQNFLEQKQSSIQGGEGRVFSRQQVKPSTTQSFNKKISISKYLQEQLQNSKSQPRPVFSRQEPRRTTKMAPINTLAKSTQFKRGTGGHNSNLDISQLFQMKKTLQSKQVSKHTAVDRSTAKTSNAQISSKQVCDTQQVNSMLDSTPNVLREDEYLFKNNYYRSATKKQEGNSTYMLTTKKSEKRSISSLATNHQALALHLLQKHADLDQRASAPTWSKTAKQTKRSFKRPKTRSNDPGKVYAGELTSSQFQEKYRGSLYFKGATPDRQVTPTNATPGTRSVQKVTQTTTTSQGKEDLFGYSQYDTAMIRQALHNVLDKNKVKSPKVKEPVDEQQEELPDVLRQEEGALDVYSNNNQNHIIMSGRYLIDEQFGEPGSLHFDENLSGLTQTENKDQVKFILKQQMHPSEGNNRAMVGFDEKFKKAKKVNHMLYEQAVTQISHLIGKNKVIHHLEPYTVLNVNLSKIEAQFWKVSLSEKQGPLKILIQPHFYTAEYTAPQDYSIAYSFTNKYPHEDDTDSFAPFDPNSKWHIINNLPLSKPYMYLGVYSKTGTESDLAVGFGHECDIKLISLFNSNIKTKQRSIESQPTYIRQLQESDSDDDEYQQREFYSTLDHNGRKILSKLERTRRFKRETNKRIKELIKNELDRMLYLKLCAKIKTKLALTLKEKFAKIQERDKSPARQGEMSGGQGTQGSPTSPPKGSLRHKLTVIKEIQHRSPIRRHSEKAFFESKFEHKKTIQDQKEKSELERYKYTMFLAIKSYVLRKIKNQKVDEKIHSLRLQKRVYFFVIQSLIQRLINNLSSNLQKKRHQKLKRARWHLAQFKIATHFRMKNIQMLKYRPPCRLCSCHKSLNKEDIEEIVFKIHKKRYLGPTFQMLLAIHRQDRTNFQKSKVILKNFLGAMQQRFQLRLKIKLTFDKVIAFQKIVKAFLYKKRYWEALIFVELEKEVGVMIDFIRVMKEPKRTEYQWFLHELQSLNHEHLKTICKNLVQFVKDIQVIDCHRYNSRFLDSEYTQETLFSLKKNVLRTKNLYLGHYTEGELIKYPPFLEFDPAQTLKMQAVESKKKKKKKALFEEPSSATAAPSSPATATKKRNIKRMLTKLINENQFVSEDITEDEERIVTTEEIEQVYLECGIRMREFKRITENDLFPEEPTISIPDTMEQMKQLSGILIMLNQNINSKTMKYLMSAEELNAYQRSSQIRTLDTSLPMEQQQPKRLKPMKGVLEMNAFREMVIYALIEQQRAEVADYGDQL